MRGFCPTVKIVGVLGFVNTNNFYKIETIWPSANTLHGNIHISVNFNATHMYKLSKDSQSSWLYFDMCQSSVTLILTELHQFPWRVSANGQSPVTARNHWSTLWKIAKSRFLLQNPIFLYDLHLIYLIIYFGSKKMVSNFKKSILTFDPLWHSNDHTSWNLVICRMVLCTILGICGQNALIIWFLILSRTF